VADHRSETPGEEIEVAWLAMPEKAPVMDQGGQEIGRAEELLGDKEDDIFHGIVVKLSRSGRQVEVRADRIPKITTQRIYTDLADDELERLPEYR
jgi:hypothetical protein